MFHRRVLMLASLLALFAPIRGEATVLTLSPSADTRILEFFPSNPFGDDVILSVFNNFGNVQRTLIQVDLSAIPAGQQINSATLTLFGSRAFGDNVDGRAMDIHAVTTPWVEQATWLFASSGTPWGTAGGDFDPFVYATSNANPLEFNPVVWDITTLVQDWYDGSVDNNGLLLKSIAGNGLTFYSTNALNPQIRPLVSIEYAPIPEASSTLLVGAGLLMSLGVAYRSGRVRSTS
ncbi:DNRLRE domain-containing protein [bacterium]|nr:DNRLRE domain-containing protein [bacterium]